MVAVAEEEALEVAVLQGADLEGVAEEAGKQVLLVE